MEDRRTTRGGSWQTWLWAAAFVFLLLVGYVAGYIFAGEVAHGAWGKDRLYPSGPMARMFVPAAWVEAKATGKVIFLAGLNPDKSSLDQVSFCYTAKP